VAAVSLMPRDIVVVGASAGGVEALRALASGLPADLPATVLVVLHMPARGASALPAILRRAGSLDAVTASNGVRPTQGRIYVAPPDHHLLLADDRLRLSHGPTENGHRPAVDALFRSAARAAGPRVIGVVLSGVLDDGAAGLVSIARRGGLAMVQEPGDALYAGMPHSALRHVAADHVVPAAEMGFILKYLVREQVDVAAAPLPSPLDVIESNIAAQSDQGTGYEVAGMARFSGFSCPDCQGNLVELDTETARYRCRVGHAWTAEALLEQQSAELERAMWTALRTLDEKVNLSRRLQTDARKRGNPTLSDRYRDTAEESQSAATVLRRFLLARPGVHPRSAEAADG
jgi:two-component system, chemotaxis family, protein-glutamate methylesterase/glutaminase